MIGEIHHPEDGVMTLTICTD